MHALIAAVLFATVSVGASPELVAGTQPAKYIEEYHALAANTSVDINAPSLFELEIALERYTTTAEQETMQAAFEKRKQDGLLAALQKAPKIGIFRIPGNLAWEIRYAFHYMGRDNRKRIYLITDRNVSFAEATARPRSMDYPFTVIELRVDDSGFGEGQVMVAAAIGFDRGNLSIEEFLDRPIKLTKVRRKK
jgi:hypothetical protein